MKTTAILVASFLSSTSGYEVYATFYPWEVVKNHPGDCELFQEIHSPEATVSAYLHGKTVDFVVGIGETRKGATVLDIRINDESFGTAMRFKPDTNMRELLSDLSSFQVTLRTKDNMFDVSMHRIDDAFEAERMCENQTPGVFYGHP